MTNGRLFICQFLLCWPWTCFCAFGRVCRWSTTNSRPTRGKRSATSELWSFARFLITNYRRRCILYLKLFLLGGFTWIFEVLSYMFNDHAPSAWVWMVVDSFNCLHGVLIFFVLIIWRQRIRKELAGKRILGIYCPTKWADVEDDEEVCLENEGNAAWMLLTRAGKLNLNSFTSSLSSHFFLSFLFTGKGKYDLIIKTLK